MISNRDIKEKANQFIIEFGIREVTLEAVEAALQKQGYTVIEYNSIYNDENVASLIDSLGLKNYTEQSKGFTYVDSKFRLVFLHEDLSDKEKLMILVHEEGHIYCEHFSSAPIIGKDVTDEHAANEFSHYVLNQSFAQKTLFFSKRHKKAIVVFVLALIIAVAGIVITVRSDKKAESYYGNYYITTTGSKYHLPDCQYVKNKTNVHRMTVEEYKGGEYSPCEICMPDSVGASENGGEKESS